MKKLFFVVCLLSASLISHAGGFQVNSQGQKALGMGGAFTAYNKDASSAYFNPGAMAMLDSGRYISIGATLIMPRSTFLSDKTGIIADMQPRNLYPAYLYAAIPVTDRITAGLSVNSPYLSNSSWDNNWEGRAVLQEIKLQTYYVQPTLSYKISNNFSAGAGLVYGYSDILVRRQIGEFEGDANFSGNASGFGFNVGIFGKVQEELSFGITYRSGIDFKIDKGEATFNKVPASLSAQFQNQTFSSRVNLPSTLSVGLSNRVTDKVMLTFEFNLTGWSSYDSLNFNFQNAATSDYRTARKYEDAMAFRAGLEYVPTEKLELRVGGYFDETPIRDEFIAPDFPDGNRLGGTAGLTYKLTDRFEIDAAFLVEKINDRASKVDISKTNVSNVAGQYQSVVTGAGLGLSYKF